ncbi:hypothetical protein KM043_017185 [Ampulex compressa]|nr:hypothetical protein KM043_017185 [Ampulex compressa]
MLDDATCVNVPGPRRHPYHQGQRQQQQQQHQQQDQRSDGLEDFLHFRGSTGQEMVAHEMTQSYTQLLQTGQEPQEFISLEELQPRLRHTVHDARDHIASTSLSASHLYQHYHHEQPSYYNLSSVQQ